MQKTLVYHMHPDAHIFDNINAIFGDPDIYYDNVMALPEFEDKLSYVWSLDVHSGAPCLMHPWKQSCPYMHIGLPRIAGIPCQDWSSAGNKLGLLGPQLPTALSLGRVHGKVNQTFGRENLIWTTSLDRYELLYGPDVPCHAFWEVARQKRARTR